MSRSVMLRAKPVLALSEFIGKTLIDTLLYYKHSFRPSI